MDNELFKRPAWVSHLPLIAAGSLIFSMGGTALIISYSLPSLLMFLAVISTVSPVFVLLAVIPVLNNEMRLLDSMRLGLIDQDLKATRGSVK
jgi:hypothetical protein